VLLNEGKSLLGLVVPLNKLLLGSNIGVVANLVLLASFDLKDICAIW